MSRILLVGAGHARPPLLRRVSGLRRRGHEVALVATPAAIWDEAVPAVLAGRLVTAAALLDTGRLAEEAGIRLIDDDVTGLDLRAGLLHRHEGEPIGFDILSIAPLAGTRPLPGTERHRRCFTTRPLSQLLALREALEARFTQHPGRAVALTIAGGGITGCTLAVAILLLAGRLGAHVGITILTRGRLLAGLPERAGILLIEWLAAHGVIMQEQAPVARVDANEAVLANGDRVAFDLFVNATGATGPHWFQTSGLEVDGNGRLRTDEKLRVGGQDRVLAAGEAVRPAADLHPGWRVLAGNIEATATSLALARAPARRPPTMIDLGDGQALAAWGGRWSQGRIALWALRWAEGRWLF